MEPVTWPNKCCPPLLRLACSVSAEATGLVNDALRVYSQELSKFITTVQYVLLQCSLA